MVAPDRAMSPIEGKKLSEDIQALRQAASDLRTDIASGNVAKELIDEFTVLAQLQERSADNLQKALEAAPDALERLKAKVGEILSGAEIVALAANQEVMVSISLPQSDWLRFKQLFDNAELKATDGDQSP